MNIARTLKKSLYLNPSSINKKRTSAETGKRKKIREPKNILFIIIPLAIQSSNLCCGRRGTRTPKGVSQRIYSPPRLSNSGVRPDFKTSHKYIFIPIKMQINKCLSLLANN
jgi:hypothetical protein